MTCLLDHTGLLTIVRLESSYKITKFIVGISQLSLQTMKMVMFSSFNFSLELIFQTEVERKEHYHFSSSAKLLYAIAIGGIL